jgi:hypothetical protein
MSVRVPTPEPTAEELAEIEQRQAEIAAGDAGVVLDPEDEAEHLAGCAEIADQDRRGELMPAEEYLRQSREARALSTPSGISSSTGSSTSERGSW